MDLVVNPDIGARLRRAIDRWGEGGVETLASRLKQACVRPSSERTLWNYLSGETSPSRDWLMQAAPLLGASVDWLLSGEGPMLASDVLIEGAGGGSGECPTPLAEFWTEWEQRLRDFAPIPEDEPVEEAVAAAFRSAWKRIAKRVDEDFLGDPRRLEWIAWDLFFAMLNPLEVWRPEGGKPFAFVTSEAFTDYALAMLQALVLAAPRSPQPARELRAQVDELERQQENHSRKRTSPLSSREELMRVAARRLRERGMAWREDEGETPQEEAGS